MTDPCHESQKLLIEYGKENKPLPQKPKTSGKIKEEEKGQTLATRASSLPPSLPEPLGVQPMGSPINRILDQDDHDDDMLFDENQC